MKRVILSEAKDLYIVQKDTRRQKNNLSPLLVFNLPHVVKVANPVV